MIVRSLQMFSAALLLAIFPVAAQPQAPAPAAQTAQPSAGNSNATNPTSNSDRRRANHLYLEASKLYVDSRFEEALKLYEQAAEIDPGNADYRAAMDVARNHLVTSLVQAAARARFTGNETEALANLRQAYALDPQNPAVTQHLYELSNDAARGLPEPLYQRPSSSVAEDVALRASSEKHSIHLRSDARQLIQDVFRTYGITAIVTDTVPPTPVQFDIDDADFAVAAHTLSLVTGTFYVPIDTHQVLVARNTRENRNQFARNDVETVYLSGLTANELTDAGNLAKNVFNVDQVSANAANSSLTLHGTPAALQSYNTSMQNLLEGRDQVMLDVSIVQLAHSTTRNTGVQLPQSITVFNVYTAEQAILSANQSLVQQIIAAGLAAPGDTLTILGILLASGQVSNSLFAGGVAFFGGGLTRTGIAPNGPATLSFSLNTSETRALDSLQMRLGDGEAGTIKQGSKYPIQTSSYSNVGAFSNIPGLTGAGNSSSLSSLLSSLTGATGTIPMIQYQDIGLTLKVTPKVLHGGDVALSAELTMDGLAGGSINGNPILNHQAYTGVVTLREGEAAELASQISESQSRAISGTPGLGDLPGLSSVMSRNVQNNYATLLIVLTPHVVRSSQNAGPTRQMIVEKGINQ
jgi:type II secretory pathway component GspD/PulD (secretin)